MKNRIKYYLKNGSNFSGVLLAGRIRPENILEAGGGGEGGAVVCSLSRLLSTPSLTEEIQEVAAAAAAEEQLPPAGEMEGGGGEWAARGAVWREKARDLQIRLRDRFRVTVTRPRRWRTALPEAADSCYSATLRRAILRLRSLLGDASLSSPSQSPSPMAMPPPSRFLPVKTGRLLPPVSGSIVDTGQIKRAYILTVSARSRRYRCWTYLWWS